MAPRQAAQRRPLVVLALVSSLMLAGCATAPIPHEVERTQTYADNQEVIWQRAVAFFAARNLSIKTIDKASGIIAADRAISVPASGLEGYADCGTAPLLRRVAQTIDLNLFVRRLDDGRTSVTVNTRFTETRMLGYNIVTVNTLTCLSTGKLEDDILLALRRPL